MKKTIKLIVVLLVSLQVCVAGNIKKINVTFDRNDFTLSMNSSGLLDIVSNKQVASYGEDVSEPGLPLIPVNVLIPEGSSFSGLTVTTSKKLVRENVTIAANPRIMPTNKTTVENTETLPNYTNKTYPTTSGVYKCTTSMDGYTILNFLVSPFEYDAESKRLYLHESVTLSINLGASNARTATFSNCGNNASDIIKSLVINNEDIDAKGISTLSTAIDSNNGNVEYLIVTSNALSSYFQPIAQWKKMKGISSKIITIVQDEVGKISLIHLSC